MGFNLPARGRKASTAQEPYSYTDSDTVFICWSSQAGGKEFAELMSGAIEQVFPGVRGRMSTQIDKGRRWLTELLNLLKNAATGIVCITPGSEDSAWIMFEAGMLWQKSEHIYPLIISVDDNDKLNDGPLGKFQTSKWGEPELQGLFASLAEVIGYEISAEDLQERVSQLWPEINRNAWRIAKKYDFHLPPQTQRERLERFWDEVRTKYGVIFLSIAIVCLVMSFMSCEVLHEEGQLKAGWVSHKANITDVKAEYIYEIYEVSDLITDQGDQILKIIDQVIAGHTPSQIDSDEDNGSAFDEALIDAEPRNDVDRSSLNLELVEAVDSSDQYTDEEIIIIMGFLHKVSDAVSSNLGDVIDEDGLLNPLAEMNGYQSLDFDDYGEDIDYEFIEGDTVRRLVEGRVIVEYQIKNMPGSILDNYQLPPRVIDDIEPNKLGEKYREFQKIADFEREVYFPENQPWEVEYSIPENTLWQNVGGGLAVLGSVLLIIGCWLSYESWCSI